MRVQVIMPQMGESIVEGTVVAWKKKVGDKVRRDEDIFTISTDKVDAEIPSPSDGVLVELLASVGQTLVVGAIVAWLETDEAAASNAAAAPSAAPVAPVAAAPAGAPAAAPTATKTAQAAAASAPQAGLEELRRTRSTPLVRKMAAAAGISDLARITGSGVSGRVTKSDLLSFIEKAGTSAPVAPMGGRKAALAGGFAIPTGYEPAFVKTPRIHLYANDRVEPMGRMRASIAENMLQSRRATAHAHTVWEADVTPIMKARKKLVPEYEAKGVNLTLTAFFVAAVVEAIKAFPILNATVDGDNIIFRGSINLGIASAIEEGLIVPVLKEADSLNLLGVARAVNDLSFRSKNRQLKPADVTDGTFTITNSGIFGSLYGIPILVPGQAAILNIGGIKKRVVADDNDNILVRSMCMMCLSFDHRIIDGASADGFMKRLVESLTALGNAK